MDEFESAQFALSEYNRDMEKLLLAAIAFAAADKRKGNTHGAILDLKAWARKYAESWANLSSLQKGGSHGNE